MSKKSHTKLYSYAKYYDIAFDFKNIKSECDFLEEIKKKFLSDSHSKTFIEFAAGPALHTIEMAHRGWKSTAIDISREMRAYGLEKAAKENVKINYKCADMVTFKSRDRFDLAAIFLDSTSYILTNDDMIKHLRNVAACLNRGGLYILEMSHPKEVILSEKLTKSTWEASRDGCSVEIQWGSKNDVFDPVTQITDVIVTMNFNDHGKKGTITDKSQQRHFTVTEFDAIVKAAGVFRIASIFGAMKTSVRINDKKDAWRMVTVLMKK